MGIRYLAIIQFAAGGSYGIDSTQAGAERQALRNANDFAKAFGGFKPDAQVAVNVWEIDKPGALEWDASGVWYAETGERLPASARIAADLHNPHNV